MGDAARVAGLDTGIEFKGKKYPLADMCIEIRGAFELWLEDRAWKAALRAERSLPPDKFQAMLKGVVHDITSGIYSFYGEVAEKAREQIEGHAYFLYLRLKMANREADEVTEEFVKEMMEAKGQEVLQTLLLKDLDPNEEAPAASDSQTSS